MNLIAAFKDSNVGDNKMSHTCFAAGTLVHTEQGLIAIEQLKIGDKVLSKAADGSGELVYKRIRKTMTTDNVPIFLMEFEPYVNPTLPMSDRINLRRALKKQMKPEPLFVTANHPFCTTNHGWLKAEQLTTQDPMMTREGQKFVSRRGGGFDAKYKGIVPILKTDREKLGYVVNYGDDTGQIPGYFVDLQTKQEEGISSRYRPIIDKLWINDHEWKQHLIDQTPEEHREDVEFYGFRQGHWRDPDTVEWSEGEGPLTMTVYNIEVEDTHTYFVGDAGIWVHNCGGEETFSKSLTVENFQKLLPAAMKYWINDSFRIDET
ncbi:Hint domain-containing protein [Acinetobacter guillouiae]|uniref:Hint domain-containing protein n=1 Tax=Acinetobacter guillouiae TaxID=106649 RepID=UPI003AF52FAA